MTRISAALLLCAACAFGQTNDLYPRTANHGSSLPATCSVGNQFQLTSASASQQIYACTAPSTWTAQAGGGGGGTGVLPSTTVTMSGNSATFAANTYGTFLTTLTANLTTFTWSGTPVDGELYTFVFTQDATGGRTVTYPASFVPNPAQPTPDASSTTIVQCTWNAQSSKCTPVGTTAGHGFAPTTSAPSGTPPSGYVFTWYDSTGNVLYTKDSSGATHSGGGASLQTIRNVSTTTDTIQNTDCGNIVAVTTTSNVTETWPQAGSAGFASGCKITFTNSNVPSSGEMVTHSTSTSNFTNMGGSATYYWTPPGITETFISDGTNWEIQTTWPKTLWVYAQNSFCASSDGATYANLADATSIACNNSGTTQTYLLNSGSGGNSPFAFPANFFNSANSKVRIDLDMYQTGTGNINSDFRMHLNNNNTATLFAFRANNTHWSTGTNLSGSFSYTMGPNAAPGGSTTVITTPLGGGTAGTALMSSGSTTSMAAFATNGALPLNFSWGFASTTATNAVMLRRVAVTWLSF